MSHFYFIQKHKLFFVVCFRHSPCHICLGACEYRFQFLPNVLHGESLLDMFIQDYFGLVNTLSIPWQKQLKNINTTSHFLILRLALLLMCFSFANVLANETLVHQRSRKYRTVEMCKLPGRLYVQKLFPPAYYVLHAHTRMTSTRVSGA